MPARIRGTRAVRSNPTKFKPKTKTVASRHLRPIADAIKASVEGLEHRQMRSTYYVNDNWVEQVNSAPGGTPGIVEPGDIVKSAPLDSPSVTNLVFDTQAFNSVQSAVNKFFVTGLGRWSLNGRRILCAIP